MTLLEGLSAVIDPSRVVSSPVTLTEGGKGNKCAPVEVSYRGGLLAVRLHDTDFSAALAGSKGDETKSFRRLPDYLLFAEPRERRAKREPLALHVAVCELKSSDKGAASGVRQVQLGKLFAEYLIRVAAFANGAAKAEPILDVQGVIVRPTLPAQIRAKGTTRADEDDGSPSYDELSDMWIHDVAAGEPLRLEDLFR